MRLCLYEILHMMVDGIEGRLDDTKLGLGYTRKQTRTYIYKPARLYKKSNSP